ncbi:MAG: hypothetical protein R6X35_04870 [Candidatus Krumholzibacteriia bacterium]
MTKKLLTATRALALIALTVTLTSAAPAAAGNDDGCGRCERDREGWLVGLNAGWGHSSFGAKEGSRTFTDESFGGDFGGLRAGYAFSNSFALTLEGYGFGSDEGGTDWGMGAGFATVTWFPGGGGFFVRGGLGIGGGEVLLRDTGRTVEFDSRAAGLFGIGYEWQLGRNFALGVAADGFGFDLGGASGLDEDFVGSGGMSIQLNWYL